MLGIERIPRCVEITRKLSMWSMQLRKTCFVLTTIGIIFASSFQLVASATLLHTDMCMNSSCLFEAAFIADPDMVEELVRNAEIDVNQRRQVNLLRFGYVSVILTWYSNYSCINRETELF